MSVSASVHELAAKMKEIYEKSCAIGLSSNIRHKIKLTLKRVTIHSAVYV